MRIATLNVQNLRLLQDDGGGRLRGAWDSDDPEDPGLDPVDRRLTAALIGEVGADVVALQEVFDRATLEHFHDRFLLPAGMAPYPERICLAGNDGRGLDVALLSRRRVDRVQSHADLRPGDLGIAPPEGTDPGLPVFRRDCLMAVIGRLTLFVCHFKSPYPDAAQARAVRRAEAWATRRLVERYFDRPAEGLWLILGDLNEPEERAGSRAGSRAGEGAARAIAPLEGDFSVDLMARRPAGDRWTYHDPHSGRYHCPDKLLASPALAALYPGARPEVIRKGLGRESARFAGPRLAGVGQHRPHASDHAAVAVDFPGL